MGYHNRNIGWFLAQFKPNSHNIATRNLARQGFRTFLPLQEATQRVRGKFATRMRPLFPGYLFVELDILDGGWRSVNSTYGVSRLVCLGHEPTPVPGDLISQMMLRCDCEGVWQPSDPLKPGEQVTLGKGPLTDFVGTIEHVDADRRIHLLMEIMGAQVRVSVSADQVRVR